MALTGSYIRHFNELRIMNLNKTFIHLHVKLPSNRFSRIKISVMSDNNHYDIMISDGQYGDKIDKDGVGLMTILPSAGIS